MEKHGIYALIGICAVSALLGIGLGYFIFGPVSFSAQTNAQEYEALQKYVPQAEPDFLLAYSDLTLGYAPDTVDSFDLAEVPHPAEHPEQIYQFMVTSLDGYIVVYRSNQNGQGEIIETTSTAVNALPLVEQQRLAQGIRVYTEEALIRILEDYGS